MASFDYEIWTKSVFFKFRCPKCGQISGSGELGVPYPDCGADNFMASEVREEHKCQCEHCGHTIDIDVISRNPYGTVAIYGLDDDDLIQYDSTDEEDDYESFGFYTDTQRVLDSVGSLPIDVKLIIYRLLFANSIAYMENYLCKKAKEHILKDEQTIRALVEQWNDCSAKLRIKKKELLNLDYMSLKREVSHYLNDCMTYHNLKLTRKLFKDFLEIDLGDTEQLEKAVILRHDIVHRSGRNTNDLPIVITQKDVEKVHDDVDELIININSQIVTKMLKEVVNKN